MYDLVGGRRFFFGGGFKIFWKKLRGFQILQDSEGGQIYLAMINLDDLGETEKLTRLRTTSTPNAGLPHM